MLSVCLAVLTTLGCAPADPPPAAGDNGEIVVAMKEFEGKRPAANFFARALGQNENLVARGRVEVDGQTYEIYLPHPMLGYSTVNTLPGDVFYNSTAIGVDHDGDGELSPSENFHAHQPVRVGDAMFQVTHIAKDGSELRLRETEDTVTALTRGLDSDALELKATDGRTYALKSFRGKAMLLKFWSPT